MDKSELIAAWKQVLEERLARAERGQAEATAGTRVDGSHRPANRGERGAVTAQGYLAHGLGQRALELAEALRILDEVGSEPRERVVVGALVELAEDDQPFWIAVLPGGDASEVALGAHSIKILSAQAPLVRALSGREPDDEVTLALTGRQRVLEILQVL